MHCLVLWDHTLKSHLCVVFQLWTSLMSGSISCGGEKQRTFILLKEVLSYVCQMNLKKGYCWHTLSLLNRFGSIRVQLNPITVISVTLQLVFWLQIICRVTLIIQTIYNSATTFNARFKKSTTTKKKPQYLSLSIFSYPEVQAFSPLTSCWHFTNDCLSNHYSGFCDQRQHHV